jgi:hypothetical protein
MKQAGLEKVTAYAIFNRPVPHLANLGHWSRREKGEGLFWGEWDEKKALELPQGAEANLRGWATNEDKRFLRESFASPAPLPNASIRVIRRGHLFEPGIHLQVFVLPLLFTKGLRGG